MTTPARSERLCLAILLLIFTCFTAHGLRMFFSGDDMMNMYEAWILNPWKLGRSLLFPWMPAYRPLGAVVYRIFYAIFGFHNLPLYVFCWLLLAFNVLLSYRFFRIMGAAVADALIAVSLTLVHGNFQDLYLSAGTIYDRLWFLFTLLGLNLYARVRTAEPSRPPLAKSLLIGLLCLLAIDSKESGVALPVLLACYEAIFILPEIRRRGVVRNWLSELAPLYAGLALLSLVFIFMRVPRTPELSGTSAYHPHVSISVWLTHVGEYFTALVYQHISFPPWATAILLLLAALGALWARNRLMLFGWIFFVIAITPVALITTRPGYVLYVPDVGLGLYAAGLIALLPALTWRLQMTLFVAITAAMSFFHARNWPGPFPPEASPEKRFSEQFEREYPKLPAHTRLLFVSDDFPPLTWDLPFNTWLLYHDRSIVVHRLMGPPDQQAKPGVPVHYDHVFAVQDGHYIELDNRDVADSVRLHILRNYSVGREMDFSHRDYSAYVVSGVLDGDMADSSRWIGPHARFKFDLYPAPAVFSANFYVPDVVANSQEKTLIVSVNQQSIGSVPLTHSGLMQLRFPVTPREITGNGYTLVDLAVDKPYKSPEGQEFGVVLMRAGFEYQEGTSRPMK